MDQPVGPYRVLKIVHSGVVTAWRERERALRRRGVDVRLLSAATWDEGGTAVTFSPDGDDFATGVRTIGTHPNLFLFDPRPLWRALGEPWDVVDIHEEPCSLAAAEILVLRTFRRSRAPYILYSAQNIDKRYPPPFRWIERLTLAHAGGASVCNHAARLILERKGLAGPAAEIPLGVDVALFAPSERRPPAGGALRIGYVGRLAPHKGVATLLDAVAGHPEWALELVGGGPDGDTIRARIAALGLADRVTLSGPCPVAALPERYRTFDVVAVPSLPTPGWEEQFCRVAVEAMASGVPVVASRSGAIPDVVGEAGLLVEPGDADDLAAALSRLAGDPERWAKARAAGLARAADFTWEAVAEDYLDLYRAVTGASVGSGRSPSAGRPAPVHRPNRPQATAGAGAGPMVVVVAYGDPAPLAECLGRLDGRHRVVVVDNSSDPATRALVETRGFEYVDPGANVGFGAGVNHALRIRPGGTDVLLLNPDAVVAPSDIDRLHRALGDDPGLAAVAPDQVDPTDGTPARVAWPVPTPSGAWLEALGLGRLRRRGEFLIGSVLLLRAEALDQVGGFDERFFLYAEETDWQIRARRLGWRVRLVPEVVAIHVGAGTGGDPRRRETHFHASHERLVRKHHGPAGWWSYRAATVIGTAARAIALPGERGAAARRRLHLYVHGPIRAEEELR